MINLENKRQVRVLCKQLECTEEDLRYCIDSVGCSLNAIEVFFAMNKHWIPMRVQFAKSLSRPAR